MKRKNSSDIRRALRRALSLGFLTVTLTACSSPPPSAEPSPPGRVYRIGYMICNSEAETLSRFRPLTAYLADRLKVRFEAVAIDTINFTRHVDTLDFTHTNSILYIIMHRNHGVEVLAGEKAGSLGARSRGAIGVLKKSGMKTLADLRGKTMFFGPMYAPTAYMTQLDLLLQNGIDPEDDLARYSFPAGEFKHEKVIYGVWFGAADAGAFPMLDFERMAEAGRIDPDDFTILAAGPPLAYCNFAATQRVDGRLAAAFKNVLLEITKESLAPLDGEKIGVLSAAWIDGYEAVTESDFDSVREMAKRTNMPPYQQY